MIKKTFLLAAALPALSNAGAAPVAIDALKNATRCTRSTSTPREAAASVSRLRRFSGLGSQANATNATAHNGRAASSGP